MGSLGRSGGLGVMGKLRKENPGSSLGMSLNMQQQRAVGELRYQRA